MTLYHLVAREAWEAARAAGVYAPPSLATEGFIHLTTDAQWPGVRARFYADAKDLLVLAIDAARLASPVVFEPADGDRFPHLYGPLPIDAVTSWRSCD